MRPLRETYWMLVLLVSVTASVLWRGSPDYLHGLAWAWGVTLLVPSILPKLTAASDDHAWLARAWLVRLLVVLVLGVWVEGFYRMRTGLDADMYHRVGAFVAGYFKRFRVLPEDVERRVLLWDGTVHYILQTSVFYGLWGASAQMMKVINTTVAFLGMIGFYRVYRFVRPDDEVDLPLLFLFFMPSALYWTSIHGKDPWMYAFLGMATFFSHRYLQTFSLRHFIMIVLGVLGMAWIRPHVAAIFTVSLAVFGFLYGARSRRALPLLRMVGVVLIFAVAAFAVRAVMEAFGVFTPEEALEFAVRQGEASAYGRSAIQLPEIGSFLHLFLFYPLGFITVLFRPFPWEARSPFALVSAAENLILLLFSLAILRKRRWVPSHAIGLFAGIYVLLFILAFYPASGNLGTLVRQKVQLLPFWFLYLGSLPERKHHVRD